MHRYALDFANGQRSVAVSRPGVGIALLLAGIVALGSVVWDVARQNDRNAALQERRQSLVSRLQRRQIAEPISISAELAAQVTQANTVRAQLAAPWEAVFQALEPARSEDIGLLSLAADAGKQDIALNGEAKDFAALGAFADRLSSNEMFRQVTVANHKLSDGAPPIVVKFDLRLRWRQSDTAAR